MKYIYSLLLIFFAMNQLSAENWVKAPENTGLKFFAQNQDKCFIFNARHEIDSFDTDCIKKLDFFTISTEFIETDTFNLEEANFILQYVDSINFLDIQTYNYFRRVENSTILLNLDALKSVSLNTVNLSFEHETVHYTNIPFDINEIQINVPGKHLILDTIKNVNIFTIYSTFFTTEENNDSLILDISEIDNVNEFLCSQYITNELFEFPENLETISIVVDNRNASSVIQKIAQTNEMYDKLRTIVFQLREDFATIDITSISKINHLEFYPTNQSAIIQQLRTNKNHTSFRHHHVNIKNLELHEGLEFYSAGFISDTTFKIPEFNNGLKDVTLWELSNISIPYFPESLESFSIYRSDSIAIPPFNEKLQFLLLQSILSPIQLNTLPPQLEQLFLFDVSLDCLPTFPASLREFAGELLTNISCIPNETPWVKATAEWPLCTDVQLVCDKDSFEIINGKVYLDINNNGVIDSNDQLLPNAVISTDKDQLANSKQDGTYGIILREAGSYLLSATYNHPHFKQSVPANVTVNYQEGQPIDSVHFLIQVDNKNDVQINGTNLVARPGMSTKVISFVENLSLENKSGLTVKILKPADWDLEEALPVGYAVSNDTIIWNNVSLAGLKSTSFSVSSTLPPTATILGDLYQYQMWVENEGDITPENNYYSITDTIIGSYDPNDKIVNHSTLTPELSNSKELIYTIRFQNTGTDTAFKVVIIDTIIGNLDPSSIRVLGASHNYSWSFSGQGIATFVFDNILLPDSNINEPGSHGFVTLVLRPSKDLVIGDSIYNRAGIYFDFNEPVITNHANTKIATVTPVYSHSNIPLSIYPNPAKNQVRVEWKVAEPAILRLSDISGKVIRTERLNNGFTDINVSQLPKGLYIVQLQAGQHMAVSKLIVQ